VVAVDEHDAGSLDERVGRLESEVGELRTELRYALRRVNRLLAEGETGLPALGAAEQVAPPRPGERTAEVPRGVSGGGVSREARRLRLPLNLGGLRSGEWWLNKIGIGLLILGVAFLFMLAVERGWIGPSVRVGFGLAVGGALLALGLRVGEHRRAFSRVLLGGAIGTLYMSVFAAFQLYGLVSYPVALASMIGVTLLAFSLALRQSGVTLSLIGAAGGLGTPFLLYTDSESLAGLVLYTCLVLAGTGAVYLRKGWISLLAVSFAGGWTAFLIGYAGSFLSWAQPSSGERQALQAGVAFAWLLFWLAPVARGAFLRQLRGLAHAFVVSTPLVALAFTGVVWELSARQLGWITISAAALYALASLALRRTEGPLAYTHALVALLLLTLAFVLMLRNDVLFFALAAEAGALHFAARRLSDRIVSLEAHLLSFAVALWLGGRLLLDGALSGYSGAGDTALLNARTAVDLAVIALGFASSLVVMPRRLDLAYRIASHAALLALLWRELSALPGPASDAYVTLSWGLYAVGLLLAGLRLDRASLVRGGMATLFVVIGKLFLVDLSEVEPAWRVVLFLGFGGLFLALSYHLRGIWRPSAAGAPDHRFDTGTKGR
jgi:uncharacterized membrane protein